MDTKKLGKIYLLPCEMGEQEPQKLFPIANIEVIKHLQYYIVENARTARRNIKKMCREVVIDSLSIQELDKHTDVINIENLLAPVIAGNDLGIMSEAGMPCIADPGNIIVAKAHELGIQIVPLIGPNSILLALISSGFSGQNFTFHGYIPIKDRRVQFIQQMEVNARKGHTQIFMETPYRNQKLFEELIQILKPDTKLCIATNITLSDESIQTKTIQNWKKQIPDLNKKPSIFVIG